MLNESQVAVRRKACVVANIAYEFAVDWRDSGRPPSLPDALTKALADISADDFRGLQQQSGPIAASLITVRNTVKDLRAGQSVLGSASDLLSAFRTISEEARRIEDEEKVAKLDGISWTHNVVLGGTAPIPSAQATKPPHEAAFQAAHCLAERLRELQNVYRDASPWLKGQTPGFVAKHAATWLWTLNVDYERGQKAIRAIEHEMARARFTCGHGPAKYGPVSATSAHVASSTLASEVLRTAWNVLARAMGDGMLAVPADNSGWQGSYESVWPAIKVALQKLAEFDAGQLIADIEGEYAKVGGALPASQLATPEEKLQSQEPSVVIASLPDVAKARRPEDEAAGKAAIEQERRAIEHAARREVLSRAFYHVFNFTTDESRAGRQPSLDSFARWAQRFAVLGDVICNTDQAIPGLHLERRLQRAVSMPKPSALKFAVDVLLFAIQRDTTAVATALAEANHDDELRHFERWLPFIFERLWEPSTTTLNLNLLF